MSAEEFNGWLALMRQTRGWGQADAARALEVNKNTVSRWKRQGCPVVVAYACAAIACNLSPYPVVWAPDK